MAACMMTFSIALTSMASLHNGGNCNSTIYDPVHFGVAGSVGSGSHQVVAGSCSLTNLTYVHAKVCRSCKTTTGYYNKTCRRTHSRGCNEEVINGGCMQ